MKLEMTNEFQKMIDTSDLATLSFIQSFVKDLSSKVKIRNISSHLGLQHPSGHPSVYPFHPVQDGFENTLHRQRDLIESMNVKRRSISNKTPMFPQIPQNLKRQSWSDDLDRAEE